MFSVVRAEMLKWLRSWFPLVTIAASLSGPLLICLQVALHGDTIPAQQFMQNLLFFHLVLTGPLVVTLIGAQQISSEYQWGTWKLLLTASVPRWAIYEAKWLLGVAWIMALSLLVPAAAFVCTHLVAAPGSLDYVLWIKIYLIGGIGLCTLLPLYHLITLISRSFFVTSAVGIIASFVALLFLQTKYVSVYPISSNLLMARMRLGLIPPGTDLSGTPLLWTVIPVAITLLGMVGSLAYVQTADYR